MVEVALIGGIFLILAGLIFLVFWLSRKGATSDAEAEEQASRAETYRSYVLGRKRAKDAKEARENAARRRALRDQFGQ